MECLGPIQEMPEKSIGKRRINRIKDYISDNLSSDLKAAAVSKKFEVSISSLQHIFKKFLGQSYHHYLEDTRMKKAFELLSLNGKSVKEVVYATGYKNRATFNKAFKKRFKHSPAYYKK